MSTADISRAERRKLKRLTAENEPTIEADRRFFARFHWRTHRIRRASQAEAAINALLDERWRDLPEDMAAFVAIKQIAPGVRLRTFLCGAADNDTDVAESEARELFERFNASPQAKLVERQIEEAFGRREQS